MSKGYAKGNNPRQRYIYGRENVNWQGPQAAQRLDSSQLDSPSSDIAGDVSLDAGHVAALMDVLESKDYDALRDDVAVISSGEESVEQYSMLVGAVEKLHPGSAKDKNTPPAYMSWEQLNTPAISYLDVEDKVNIAHAYLDNDNTATTVLSDVVLSFSQGDVVPYDPVFSQKFKDHPNFVDSMWDGGTHYWKKKSMEAGHDDLPWDVPDDVRSMVPMMRSHSNAGERAAALRAMGETCRGISKMDDPQDIQGRYDELREAFQWAWSLDYGKPFDAEQGLKSYPVSEACVNNRNTPPEVLSSIAAAHLDDPIAPVGHGEKLQKMIEEHPQVNDKIREQMKSYHDARVETQAVKDREYKEYNDKVQADFERAKVKADAAFKKDPKLQSRLDAVGEQWGDTGQERIMRFNPEDVKAVGEEYIMHRYVRLFGATYDEKTGIVKGYTD